MTLKSGKYPTGLNTVHWPMGRTGFKDKCVQMSEKYMSQEFPLSGQVRTEKYYCPQKTHSLQKIPLTPVISHIYVG